MSGSTPASSRIFSANAVPAVDAQVQTIEDEFQASLHAVPNLGSLSLTSAGLPQRPGYGKNGKPFVAWANYVELKMNPDQPVLKKYVILVQPKVIGRKLHRVIQLLLTEPQFSTVEHFTDFKATLILRKDGPEHAVFNIRYFHDDEDGPNEKSTVYHVRIEKTDTLNVQDLLRHIDPRNGAGYTDQVLMLHVLNTMLYQQSRSNPACVAVGKKTFPLSGPALKSADLKSGLKALRGFYASVRLGAGRVLVNVNVTYNVFYKSEWLHNLINEFGYDDKRLQKLGSFLKFLRVKKTHLKKVRKDGTTDAPTGTIWGLASPGDGTKDSENRNLPHPPYIKSVGAGPKDVKFWDGEANIYITVYDYFRQRYGLTLQHVDMPVLNTGSPQRPVYVPAEVCFVPDGQHASMRKVTLTGDQTTIMLDMAVKKPAENFQLIMDHGLTVTGLKQTVGFLDGRFAKVPPQLLTVNARQRIAPKVTCAKPVTVKGATWNLQGHKFHKPGRAIQSWRWLLLNVTGFPSCILPSSAMQTMHAAADALRKALQATGITIAPPQSGKKSTLSGESDLVLAKILSEASEGVDLLWIIVPDKIKLLYDRIKHITDVRIGVTNFVSRDIKIAGPKAASGLPQYLGNEALKINLKLGGSNQIVDRLYFVQQSTMVVGIDVTHPSTDQTRGGAPSVAAMVASVDRYLATWFAEISIQTKRQEKVADLDRMLKSRLKVWQARNGSYPQRILIYRDGVSEGQFDMVKNEEEPLLEKALIELYKPANQPRPSMTIIIVAKRHHTRLAPSTSVIADGTSNCPAGTVVDRGITSPTLWQFFLQPHSAIQGSARPGFYTVVMDEIFRKAAQNPAAGSIGAADMCEDLTQSLCYTFGRATRAVGIVTPAYYADIVCTRAACYLNAIAASNLVQGYAQAHRGERGSSEITPAHRDQLQAQVETHMNLKESMFFI